MKSSLNVLIGSMLLLLGMSSHVYGIVNIENERVDTPEKGLHGQVKHTLSGAQGNSNRNTIHAGAKVTYGFDQRQVMFLLQRSYAEVDDDPNTDNMMLHLRYITPYEEFRDFEIFTQYERDEFQSLQARGLLGAGYRITLVPSSENTKNIFGLGAFFEREDYLHAEEDREEQVRGNFYWSFQGKLTLLEWRGSAPHFSNTLYFQPSLKGNGDTRALYLASLSFEVYKAVLLGFELEMLYDSDRPTGLEDNDLNYRQTLQYRF